MTMDMHSKQVGSGSWWNRSKVWFNPCCASKVLFAHHEIRKKYVKFLFFQCHHVLRIAGGCSYLNRWLLQKAAKLRLSCLRTSEWRWKTLERILDFFNKGRKTLMDREVRRLALPFSPRPSACVCALNRAARTEDGGPSRSSGLLCIVYAASGCFVCVCLWLDAVSVTNWPG